MSSISIQFLVKEINNIYLYHTYPSKLGFKIDINVPNIKNKFLGAEPLFSPKLIRSNLKSLEISNNENKFFGNFQIIEFYRKYKLLVILNNKIIKSISEKWLKEIDTQLFHFLIKDYLFPSYDTFHIHYPNTLFRTLHNSKLNPKKLSIFIVRTLLLNYEDILNYCPSLYDDILWNVIKSETIFNRLNPEYYSFSLLDSIVDYILQHVETFYKKENDLKNYEKYEDKQKLKDIVKNVLKMFIYKYKYK